MAPNLVRKQLRATKFSMLCAESYLSMMYPSRENAQRGETDSPPRHFDFPPFVFLRQVIGLASRTF